MTVLLVRARAGSIDAVLQVPLVLADGAGCRRARPPGRPQRAGRGRPPGVPARVARRRRRSGCRRRRRAGAGVTGEQSNTSVILPGAAARGILKVLRAVAPGENPDVDVPRHLVDVGWANVPAPLAWLQGEWPGPDGEPVTGYLGVLSRVRRRRRGRVRAGVRVRGPGRVVRRPRRRSWARSPRRCTTPWSGRTASRPDDQGPDEVRPRGRGPVLVGAVGGPGARALRRRRRGGRRGGADAAVGSRRGSACTATCTSARCSARTTAGSSSTSRASRWRPLAAAHAARPRAARRRRPAALDRLRRRRRRAHGCRRGRRGPPTPARVCSAGTAAGDQTAAARARARQDALRGRVRVAQPADVAADPARRAGAPAAG